MESLLLGGGKEGFNMRPVYSWL